MFNGKKLNTEEPLKSTHQLILQISCQEIKKQSAISVPFM